MKKILKRFRDRLIRKLGGFTQQDMHDADDVWISQISGQKDSIAGLKEENRQLKSRNSWQRNEIMRLNEELTKAPPYEFKMGDQHIKPFRMTLTHTNDFCELGGTLLSDECAKEMRRYMASKLGQELLENGAINVSEVTDLANRSVDVQMEVRVVV